MLWGLFWFNSVVSRNTLCESPVNASESFLSHLGLSKQTFASVPFLGNFSPVLGNFEILTWYPNLGPSICPWWWADFLNLDKDWEAAATQLNVLGLPWAVSLWNSSDYCSVPVYPEAPSHKKHCPHLTCSFWSLTQVLLFCFLLVLSMFHSRIFHLLSSQSVRSHALPLKWHFTGIA